MAHVAVGDDDHRVPEAVDVAACMSDARKCAAFRSAAEPRDPMLTTCDSPWAAVGRTTGIIRRHSMIIGPGSRLDAYELVQPLGSGSMGEVWLATEGRLGRKIAVKVFPG